MKIDLINYSSCTDESIREWIEYAWTRILESNFIDAPEDITYAVLNQKGYMKWPHVKVQWYADRRKFLIKVPHLRVSHEHALALLHGPVRVSFDKEYTRQLATGIVYALKLKHFRFSSTDRLMDTLELKKTEKPNEKTARLVRRELAEWQVYQLSTEIDYARQKLDKKQAKLEHVRNSLENLKARIEEE